MRSASHLGSSAALSTTLFILVTLMAWTNTASLFIILRLTPSVHSVPLMTYSAPLCALLPWLGGCVFWARVRKRAKLGVADRDATGFCYSMILMIVGAAYVAMVLIEPVLILVLTRVK